MHTRHEHEDWRKTFAPGTEVKLNDLKKPRGALLAVAGDQGPDPARYLRARGSGPAQGCYRIPAQGAEGAAVVRVQTGQRRCHPPNKGLGGALREINFCAASETFRGCMKRRPGPFLGRLRLFSSRGAREPGGRGHCRGRCSRRRDHPVQGRRRRPIIRGAACRGSIREVGAVAA